MERSYFYGATSPLPSLLILPGYCVTLPRCSGYCSGLWLTAVTPPPPFVASERESSKKASPTELRERAP